MEERTTDVVEVDGVSIEYYPDVLKSQRFIMALGDITDDDLPEGEKIVVTARMMRMLFGDGRYRIVDEMERRGAVFKDWLMSFFKAVGAKN